MMIALLTVLVVNAAAPVKNVNLKGMKPIAQQNQMPVAMGQVKQAPASLASKMAASAKAKAPKRKAIASANDLAGAYDWNYYTSSSNAVDPTSVTGSAGSSYVTIEAGAEENTVVVNGMFPNPLTATVDLENQTLTFAGGQEGGTSSYGDYVIYGMFYYEGDDQNEAGWYYNDFYAFIQEDGSIVFDGINWITRVLVGGEYAGYSLTPYWMPSSVMTPREPLTLVVVPDGVEKYDYNMSYTAKSGEASEKGVLVAVDGNDVYFRGLPEYFPESWIKGVKEGNTITFAAGQYVGEDSYGTSFFPYENDAVFTYNPDDESYALEGTVFGLQAEQYYDGYYTNPVLTKVLEKAAKPAQATITDFYKSDEYDIVYFNVPVVDEDGENLATSKLSYQFFYREGDVEAPVTFTKADYPYLAADITVLPYGFTEGSYIFSNVLALSMDHSTWTHIGIQSIYNGGGVENKSEIFWYDIRTSALFDFNNMEVPTSATGVTDGDITEPFELQIDGISMTVSPSTTGTPNRFWSTALGNQLRVYGGTLTFKGINRAIKNIVFEAGKWDAGNSANVGELDGQVWTGEANEVVITIAKNTQINNITVYYAEDELEEITAPDGLVTTPCLLTAQAKEASEDDSNDFEPYEAQLNIGMDGTDVYVQGFAKDIPEAWAKGTYDAVTKTVTIPVNQYMGSLDAWIDVYDYFVTGVKVQQFGERVDTLLTDIVLNFDPVTMTYTTDQTIALNEGTGTLEYYLLFNNVVISPIVEVAATPVTPTVDQFKAANVTFPLVDFVIPTTGTNGETLIKDNMGYQVWVEIAGTPTVLTFTPALYTKLSEDMTTIPYTYDDNYDIYPLGDGVFRVFLNQDITEMVLWSKIGAKSIYTAAGETNESEIGWYDLTEYWAATGVKGITTDAATSSVAYYDLQGRRVDSNAKGLILMQIRKADGTVKTVKVVR